MNILYIGSGFVGACSAVVAADSGHTTLVFDIDKKKAELFNSGDKSKIEACVFEDGLSDLVIRHKDRLTFTSNYGDVVTFLDTCDAIFLCLPTPEIGETGESNLEYFVSATEKLAEACALRNQKKQEKYITIVAKSTIPISVFDSVGEIFSRHGVLEYGIVSNPEFLVEGKAIQGSLKPDRIVIGAWEQKDFDVMRQVYRRFYDSADIKYIEVNPKEAAAGKLLANFYLFNKLAVCFDVIGRTCETFDEVSFENVRKILTTDDRIGTWGFYDSLYAGGSCFIKDARSLSHQLQLSGQSASLVNEIYVANRRQLEHFISRAEKEAGWSWADKKVAILGTAFKRDTNDIRNSASIDIVQFLLQQNVQKINIFDPVSLKEFANVFPASTVIEYSQREEDAVRLADVVIIATDWPQFRGTSQILLQMSGQGKLIMDGRRMLQHSFDDLQAKGYDIIAVGSPFIRGNK